MLSCLHRCLKHARVMEHVEPEGAVSPVTLSVVGAGHRGADAYGDFCLRYPDRARVVAVAEPDPFRREAFSRAHAIPPERQFESWEAMLARDRLSDGLLVTTPDAVRAGPVVAAARNGYDLLLEKPIAPSEEQLAQIMTALEGADVMVGVAHVLRYTSFFRTIRQLLDDGVIGRLIHLEQTEDVGYWHFAHSYVRGSWRRTAESSPMLLAKACHDLDILAWLVGRPALEVFSAGGLTHFTPGHAPPGAPDRCTDGCPAADTCPFFAPRLYLDRLRDQDIWPATAATREPGTAARLEALRTGPYGRCVYRCDNDAVDRQLVTITFDGGTMATLRVGAFTASNTRTVRLLGSHGEISGRLDTGELEVRRFLPRPGREVRRHVPWDRDDLGRSGLPDDERWTIDAGPVREPTGAEPGRHESDGHAGGDDGLMREFVGNLRLRARGVRTGMPTEIVDAEHSHRIAFAAERSRLSGRSVRL